MQHLFSWTQYFIFLFFAGIFYYTAIILKFYRQELFSGKLLDTVRFKRKDPRQSESLNMNAAQANTDTSNDVLAKTVNEFAHELKALLRQLVAQHAGKSEILLSISKLIEKYSSLGSTHFKTGIIDLIAAESGTIVDLHLTREELLSLWA